MSKQLKLSGAAYRRLETSREVTFSEICRIHKCIWKKTEKIGRKNDVKADEQAEKAKPITGNQKQDPSSFWMLDSDVHDILIILTSLLSTKRELLSF